MEDQSRFIVEKPHQDTIEGNLIGIGSLILKDKEGRDHPVKIEIGVTDQSALVLVNINTDTEKLEKIRRSTRTSPMIRALELMDEGLSIEEAERASFNPENPLLDALTKNQYLSLSDNPNRPDAIREALTEALRNVINQGFTLKDTDTIESVIDGLLQAFQQRS